MAKIEELCIDKRRLAKYDNSKSWVTDTWGGVHYIVLSIFAYVKIFV
jgi:hypothetical protein